MATVPFTVSALDGKSVEMELWDPSNGDQFDFSDNSWKSPGSVTTGAKSLTEDSNAGYGDYSLYRTTVDLSNVYSSSPEKSLIAAFKNTDDTALLGYVKFSVLNSHLTGDGISSVMGSDYRDLSEVFDLASSGGVGSGSNKFIYTLTMENSDIGIPNARVWVATDEDMNNIIAVSTTNSQGKATFFLDSGTHYFWRQHPDYRFDNPDIEEVT